MYIKKNDQKKIKTIFYTKTQIIKEYWFKINSTIKDIFNYFEKHIKEEGYSLKSNYKIFGQKINELYTISELIKKQNNDMVLDGEIWIEVEEEIFFDDENDETFGTILQPKINPFELIEYNPIKSRIKIIQCPQDIYNYCSLNKFTKESSFCNSSNSLYMSGGEISGKATDNFWIVNKNTYKITKKSMPIYKKYHSMLYIPENFIFIAGGDTLNTIIYDIENQEFVNWANMNKKHFQPGLFIYGDYIFAFSALKDKRENYNYFEKTNLTSKTPKWEKVYPQYDNSLITFNIHFFGISKCSDGNILFVGGEKKGSNYLYNPMDNKIFLSPGKNTNIPFWDKSFYKISKKYNVCIPLDFNINYQLAFIDKETESLIDVKCNKNSGAINFNVEKDKEPGNIYIQSTIKKPNNKQNIKIQIGINPKNQMKKNNEYESNNKNDFYNDNEGIKLDEERIIIDAGYNNKENNENSNPIKSNKNYHKNSYLYIPDTFIDEQIIAREIDLEGKEKNNKNHNNYNEEENNNEEDINDNNYDENDIMKEEYIFIGDLNGTNENEKMKNHNLKNKQFLYISNNVIADQIINRELQLNDNENYVNLENTNINIKEEILKKKMESREEQEIEEIEEEGDKIIINYDNGNIENDFQKKKSYINNKFLYIPYSSIDDQIIERKVNINNNKNHENNIKLLTKRENSKHSTNSGRNNLNLENNNNEILKESESKIIDYLNNKEESKIKKPHIEKKIYLPEYIIEDQIIKREIITDKQKAL